MFASVPSGPLIVFLDDVLSVIQEFVGFLFSYAVDGVSVGYVIVGCICFMLICRFFLGVIK